MHAISTQNIKMNTQATDPSDAADAKNGVDEVQSKTIKFNVGGRHFEVSRSLFNQHGDTVLGKLISDTWQSDTGKTIFIDRNGDIFAWVLDYLRYGSIELPLSVPKSMFDREMDYFGIFDDGNVTQPTVYDEMKKIKCEMNLAKAKLDEVEKRHDMLLFANHCHNEFLRGSTSLCVTFGRTPIKGLKTNIFSRFGIGNQEKDQLASFLATYYGLILEKFEYNYDPGHKYNVQIRKL